MNRVRLRDIAEKVGCSTAVVSRIVNNASGNITCRTELRDRILQAAAELNYAPLCVGRTIKSTRSFTLGVLIPPHADMCFGHAYADTILTGIEQVCREQTYDLLLIARADKTPIGTKYTSKLNTHRIDGLILINIQEETEWVPSLTKSHKNIVAINLPNRTELNRINFNNPAATALAVAELHNLGHRRIGYLGSLRPRNTPAERDRLDGFLSQCEALGLPITHLPADPTWTEPQAGKCVAEHITTMPLNERPTACIAYSDDYAIAIIRELRHLKFHTPDDISFVGIDDSTACQLVYPTLSSVRQPLKEMGAEAARYIIAHADEYSALDKNASINETHWLKLVEPTFILRESVKPLTIKTPSEK